MFRKNEPIEPRLNLIYLIKRIEFLSEFKQKFFESEKKFKLRKKIMLQKSYLKTEYYLAKVYV